MQSTKLFYKWQVLASVAPYLSLKQLLNTATLSKEFNYLFRNLIRDTMLPVNSPPKNQFQLLKTVYDRRCFIFDKNTKDTLRCSIPPLTKTLICGKHFTKVQLLGDQQQQLILTSALLAGDRFKIVQFPRFKLLAEGEDMLYCYDGEYLYRYNNLPKLDESQRVEMKGTIEGIQCVQRNAIVVYRAAADRVGILVAGNQPKLNLKEIKLPFDLTSFSVQQQLVLGSNVGYVLHNETVYELNLQQLQLREFLGLVGKKIVKLFGGKHHFFALGRTREMVGKWQNYEVVQWAHEQGFDDYVKILQVEKVNGKKLLEMDKKYMEDVLGITNAKTQQKMALRIAHYNSEHPQTYLVHGWGSTTQGQLGMHPQSSHNGVVKIKLPVGTILTHCEGNETLLMGKQGQLLVSSVDNVSGKQQWRQVTTKSTFSVACQKGKIVYLAAATKESIPQMLSGNVETFKKDKMRTAKNIMDKIAWNDNLDKEDFRVGYLDKYEGVLELPFGEIQAAEIKDYRIEYFKRAGVVVWSKKERIDTL